MHRDYGIVFTDNVTLKDHNKNLLGCAFLKEDVGISLFINNFKMGQLC